jgi:periplasmic divalent cation tolerance protein
LSGVVMGTDARIVLMTAPDLETAERIVRTLVEERLIACGNLVQGITSIYRWKGALECDSEVLVVMKTAASVVDRLLERVPVLHPYEVPELLVLPIEAGHGPYLAWVLGSVAKEESKLD